MFIDYQSKPVTRVAHEITENDKILFHPSESTSLLSNIDIQLGIEFKHYENVNIGDFIVYLNNDDVYHCNRQVFIDRNVV